MSAITKPLTKFSTSSTPGVVVGIEHLNSVESQDISALPNQPASSAKFYIVFTYQYPDGYTKTTKIPFPTAAIRNTALATFHTNNTTTI